MDQFHRRFGAFRALSVCFLLSVAPAAALAQDSSETEAAGDEIVASIDGNPITRADVREYVESLPPQYQQAYDQIFPFLVQRLIDLALIDKAADADGLPDDPEVQKRIDRVTVEVIREAYMAQLLADEVSEADVEARYQAYLEENPPKDEVKARHILLETEEEAREVIAALDEGADFAELATERSTGPSSVQGGDLGYFTGEQMVTNFADAALALEPGTYTKDPVKTEFGWHVILVEDKRPQNPPPFEQLSEQLTQELQGEAVEKRIAELREQADIEVSEAAQMPEDDEPADPGATPEAPAEGESESSQ